MERVEDVGGKRKVLSHSFSTFNTIASVLNFNHGPWNCFSRHQILIREKVILVEVLHELLDD
ncbi:unnamed protein product [Sphenostylis stenocarpa]|uniref:Uncharacterized protein n=1 Tax=Sphenostylis stenocarpa TaxID=92480 RepID=A0AA86W6B4_9FABA|nr:unnamed protein product [Sphenostylis stenocarpa]